MKKKKNDTKRTRKVGIVIAIVLILVFAVGTNYFNSGYTEEGINIPDELRDIRVAFAGVNIYDIDGTNRIPVLFDEGLASYGVLLSNYPSWSPDGQQIAFEYEQRNIYIVNGDGTNLQKLTQGGELYSHPLWSPDGQRILFRGTDGEYIVYVDSQQETLLPENAIGRWWSPDSQLVLYFSCCDDRRLMTIDVDSLVLTEIAAINTEEYVGFSATWSPDGEQILFTMGTSDHWDLFIANRDGSNRRQLTYHEANDVRPVWSPDGQTIAFLSDRDGYYALSTIKHDGTQLRKITEEIKNQQLVWSPDGQYIAFEQNQKIVLASVNEGEVIQVSDTYVPDGLFVSARVLRWHPNSTGFLYTLTYNKYGQGITELRWVDVSCLQLQELCAPEDFHTTIIPSTRTYYDFDISPFVANGS